MPVNIYIATAQGGTQNSKVARLCKEEWDLLPQVDALRAWLEENSTRLEAKDYVADIGFSPRENASGGGPVLDPLTLRRAAEIGMSIYLSEYPRVDSAPGEPV